MAGFRPAGSQGAKPHGPSLAALASATGDQQAKLTQVAIIGAFAAEHVDTTLLHARNLAAGHLRHDTRQARMAGIAGIAGVRGIAGIGSATNTQADADAAGATDIGAEAGGDAAS